MQKTLKRQLVELIDEMVERYDISNSNYENLYYSPNAWTRGLVKRRWMKKMLELLPLMESQRATYNEIRRALIFALVCNNCEDLRLSVVLAYDDLHMDELTRKYYIQKEKK